jgi:hypothetical protein
MGETQPSSAFLSYRDRITALMEAGEPFGTVEDAIGASAELTEDSKAALWLFAFSMREPGEQRQDARAHLDALA